MEHKRQDLGASGAITNFQIEVHVQHFFFVENMYDKLNIENDLCLKLMT